MIRRYRALVWLRDPKTNGHAAHPLGSFRSVNAALAATQAHARRHPIVTTNGCYHRDIARAQSYDVEDRRKRELLCDLWWQPEPEIVPSVGELGWMP